MEFVFVHYEQDVAAYTSYAQAHHRPHPEGKQHLSHGSESNRFHGVLLRYSMLLQQTSAYDRVVVARATGDCGKTHSANTQRLSGLMLQASPWMDEQSNASGWRLSGDARRTPAPASGSLNACRPGR
jgi:hypothetical protein